MEEERPSPESTLVLILGASQYPKSKKIFSSETFRHSAESFRDYLLDDDGYNLPASNLKYLFNDQRTNSQIDEEVANFLNNRKNELKQENVNVKDILVYYVGHGGFKKVGSDYFLAICNTRDDNEYYTSYMIDMLATTLNKHARFLRKYLILDSCFSAAAFQAFQSTPLAVAKEKIKEHFPDKGTTIFCASGPKDPAKTLPDHFYTMFSGALIETLKKGKEDLPEYLSISILGDLTCDLIREKFPDDAVRPEVHSPYKKDGDIANLPIFPNIARRKGKSHENIAHIEKMIKSINEIQIENKTNIGKISTNIEELTNRVNNIEKDISNTQFSDQNSISDSNRDNNYKYGLTKKQWELIPPLFKSKIQDMNKRRKISYSWATICAFICVLNWLYIILPHDFFLTFKELFTGLFIACVFMTIISLLFMLPRFRKEVYKIDGHNFEGPWLNYDIVIEAERDHGCINLVGLEMSRVIFTFCTIIYTITSASNLFIRMGLAQLY